jgi:DnaK suppressor protein
MPQDLTPQQLLAMPATDYMNGEQLAYFAHLLQSLKAEISNNAAHTGAHLRETEDAADPADRATQEEVRTLELRARDRERKLLKKVNAALRRIEDGSYGYCEETGEAIGLARLLARPTATLCVEAQERHERRERQFGH